MNESAGAATFAVGQSVAAFYALMPRLTDVRSASSNDQYFKRDLRAAEIGAAVITLGVSLVASALTGSQVPFITGAFIAVVIVAVYESTLRAN